MRNPAEPGSAELRSAATDLKRVHAEPGGKAPVIVFADADVETAAEEIAVAAYVDAGQDCTAATRVLAGPGHPRRPPADRRRGQGTGVGHRRGVRPGVERVDVRPRPGDVHGRGPRLRLCVDQLPHPLVAEMPRGGFKHSGHGKDLSLYGFEDYTRIKHVMSKIEV